MTMPSTSSASPPRHGQDGLARLLVALLVGLAAGCGCEPATPESDPGGTPESTAGLIDPPTARPEMVLGLLADVEAERHPSDGGGRAWLVDPEPARAGQPGRWEIVYEAGPLGIAVGGRVILQVSPFWGWSTPQPFDAGRPGFTTVSTEADGVTLDPWVPATGDPNAPLLVDIGGRALAAGEQVRLVYGDGPRGARADRYAESGSRFWIGVDGDGDGVRRLLEDSPTVAVAPGRAARLLLTVPSTAAPGDTVRVTVAALDAFGSRGVEIEGGVALLSVPEGPELPHDLIFAPSDRGVLTAEFVAPASGTYRLLAVGPGELQAVSNPLEVSPLGRRILWGDLHGHSHLSDGTGSPEDYHAYAREVAGLDVVALTDHDHWGFLFLDEHPEIWEALGVATDAAYEPGVFVSLHAYEWTSWIHGHRHVLHFGEQRPLLSSLDERYTTPGQLWDALRGSPALTFAHHSAGGPIATDWSWRPDPELEPVTEIMSTHGSSEALDVPRRIYSPVPGNFVRDVLDRGDELGLIASGDSHDGHPGLTHLANPEGNGGLVAFIDAEPTRESVLETLRARRVYATSGPRIVLRASLAGRAMGQRVPPGDHVLQLVVHGTEPLVAVDVIRSGAVVISDESLAGRLDAALELPLIGLEAGEYLYVRVQQADEGLAWSSPFFVREE